MRGQKPSPNRGLPMHPVVTLTTSLQRLRQPLPAVAGRLILRVSNVGVASRFCQLTRQALPHQRVERPQIPPHSHPSLCNCSKAHD